MERSSPGIPLKLASSLLSLTLQLYKRTSGLLRSGALKYDERPLWYDVYAAFPPHVQPRFDRPAPNVEVRQIFYEEDRIRAKYHKNNKHVGSVDMSDRNQRTQTQQFIESFNKIKAQGALDDNQIFEAAAEVVSEDYDNQPKESVGLLSSFSEAKSTAEGMRNIDIKNIFKD